MKTQVLYHYDIKDAMAQKTQNNRNIQKEFPDQINDYQMTLLVKKS